MTRRILLICFLELLVKVNILGGTPVTIAESRVKESSLKIIDLIGQKMCVRQCSYHSDCKAVNYNKRHLTCELLTRSGQEEPGYLQYDADSVHIHSITNDQVSGFCSNKACQAHEQCVRGKTKAFCIISECSTQSLLPKNGYFTRNRLQIGDILEFTCANGYSRRNVTFQCLSSGKIKNAEKLACYKKEGSWTIAFKIQSNSGAHPVESYNDIGTQQEKNASFPSDCMTLAKITGCTTPYRTGLLDDWEKIGVQSVLFTVTFNSTFKQEVIFDGRNTTNIDWFSGRQVTSSSWSDMTAAQTYLYFDILGLQDQNVNRFWTIMKYHSACEGDRGWFTASYNPPSGCSFDRASNPSMAYPVFRGCTTPTACIMASDTVDAEAFSVSILAENLI